MMGKGSRLERIRASDGFTTFVVCTAIFSDTFVYDLIIPFIPPMLEHRLNLPREQGLAFLTSQTKPDYIGTAMGYVSAAMGAGELIGPIIGGAMYEYIGHFAVLGLVCGILGVDILLRIVLVEKPSEPHRGNTPGQDNEEQPLLDGEREEPISRPADTQDTTKTRCITIFGRHLESDLCASFYAAIIIGTIRYAFESALVVFVSQHFSWSTSASGGIMFAFCSPAIFGPLIGHYTTKHGPRWTSVAAFIIAAISLVALGFLTHADKTTKILFVTVVTTIGICLSLLSTVQSVAFSMATKRREVKAKQEGRDGSSGVAFGGFSMAWTVGMFIGPLAAEVFVDHVSWLGFCIFLASLSAVSSVVMSFTWREWDVSEE
ncbi:hypothetical protein BLS_009955 [Venturia inaequalis]|uniref:Major facilitator superfamily (MFS) profile domain-containing protein n=1 Tax=Venturia inaequalis TaxID=5025 RepID=A0A8H3YLP8_VENIN|nr:hypothetical protein BLS_009955 [Venturia inaequalis]